MRIILLSVMLSVFCTIGWGQISEGAAACSASEILHNIILSIEGNKPLTREQKAFLAPDLIHNENTFFIELNRNTDAVQKLARLIAKSNLPQKRKEAFFGRLTCAAKSEAWEYIIFNKMTLPELLPARYSELPFVDPDELSKLAKEVEHHSNAFLAEIQGMRRPKILVSLQKAFYLPMIKCLRLRLNVPAGTEKEYYSAFFDRTIENDFEINTLVKKLPEEVFALLCDSGNTFFSQIYDIDSPLKDYIYLRLYEKIRAGTH